MLMDYVGLIVGTPFPFNFGKVHAFVNFLVDMHMTRCMHLVTLSVVIVSVLCMLGP